MNRWIELFVSINGQMKRIGNVKPSTREVSLYPEGHQYESETIYYVDNHGLYQVLQEDKNMTNWQVNNNYRPMYRKTEIETEEGTSEVMVPVGKYDTEKGIKSYSSAVEYNDTNNEELFYEDESGEYISVD